MSDESKRFVVIKNMSFRCILKERTEIFNAYVHHDSLNLQLYYKVYKVVIIILNTLP